MTIDGYALCELPYETYLKKQNNEKALLNGFNSMEANAFTFFRKVNKKNLYSLLEPSLGEHTSTIIEQANIKNNSDARNLYNDIFAAVCFTYPHYSWTQTNTKNGIPVYEYYFSKQNGSIGANHSGELIYAYNNVPHNKYFNNSDYELSDIMSSYWVNFVKTGNPNGLHKNGSELPQWKESSSCNEMLLEFGDSVKMIEDPYKKYYNYLIWK
jgi:para-nitrobenzyl esterase